MNRIAGPSALWLVRHGESVGNVADAQKFSDQVAQIDSNPGSNPWLSRAMSLRASLPAPAAITPAVPAPAAKKDDAPASAPIKLPGK